MIHPLLARQLKKLGLGPGNGLSAEQYESLVQIVSRTYANADEDRARLERSLEVSSREMHEHTQQIRHQAFHDKLTNLPNRALFMDRIEVALKKAHRDHTQAAVMFIDLDNFKLINDSLGHDAGDTLLKSVAERLTEVVRAGDTVARLGGDEFTILLEGVTSEEDTLRVAAAVLKAFRTPITLGNREAFACMSIGISMSHRIDQSPAELIKCADAAMYRAKARGGQTYVMYDDSMVTDAVNRLELETALRRAVDLMELSIVYQPLVDLQSGVLIGAEALARWQLADGSFVPPSAFIPLAEDTGLIIPIGKWVLHQACTQMRQWQVSLGRPDLTIAVNLSVKQLERPDVVDVVHQALCMSGLSPKCLKVEITESVLVTDRKDTIAKLQKLKELGVMLAVDDFGTGYSSLSSLSSFPVDVLKIDRAFVGVLEEQGDARAIIEAILAIAFGMNMRVVGEGIETEYQRQALLGMGCHTGQGYLFAKPLSPDEFAEAILQKRTEDGQAA